MLALGDALWNAQGTTFTEYLNAIRNADSTSDILSYLNAGVASSITYASSLASVYGDFQIANRQNKLNGTAFSISAALGNAFNAASLAALKRRLF